MAEMSTTEVITSLVLLERHKSRLVRQNEIIRSILHVQRIEQHKMSFQFRLLGRQSKMKRCISKDTT